MFGPVGACVLLAALLHATWNAMLHGNRDRFLSMAWMSIGIGILSAVVIAFLPLPAKSSWPYIAASGLVHIAYNISLVRAYQSGELGQTYPIARGSSPLLVTVSAALFAHERLHLVQLLGVVLVSSGIISLALQHRHVSRAGATAALMTGVTIAVYTTVDGMGVRLSGNAAAYTGWIFLFYLGMPVLYVAARGTRALRAPLVDISTSIIGGLVSIVAYAIVIWAMQFSAMGAVSALRETSVVFAVLMGRVFLKERLSVRRVAACVVIAFGAICLGT